MKRKYTATFADGTTITRSSERTYTVAWRATWTRDDGITKCAVCGFAVSRDKANPTRPARELVWRGMLSAERARRLKSNAAYLKSSGYAVEFADAVQV